MARTTDPLTTRTPDREATWAQVCGWRLARQHVAEPAADPVSAAATLCGVQAQVTSSAQLALGLRSTSSPDDLERALWADRSLVKTWAMRGTLHWLPAREYALWIAALRTRRWRITPSWERYHGVTADELAAITDAIPEALDGRQLTRDELAARIAEVTGSAHLTEQLRSGWGAVLKPAANRGLLCFGPDRARNVTFVRPQDWLDEIGPLPDADDAMWEVLCRFLDAYGPATPADVARWFGEPERMGRQLLAAHADRLHVVDVEGQRGWVTAAGAATLADSPPAAGVELLGGFDPYILAPISHRDALIPDGHLADVSRTAGWISAVVLVDGRVAGTWTTDAAGDGTRVTVTAFRPLTSAHVAAIEQRATSLGGHLLPGPVTTCLVAAP